MIDLGEDFYRFVSDFSKTDPSALRLSCHGKDMGFDTDFAVTQIDCRRRCARKLPGFIAESRFLFPSVVASEQASHESVAKYHASLVGVNMKVLDMTAGLGIDAMSVAMSGNEVTACDIEPRKTEILSHNAEVMSVSGLSVLTCDSIGWLRDSDEFFDIIFVDPARRDVNDRRVYGFHECQPDVIDNMALLRERCGRLIIKASPLLDVSRTIADIPSATAVRAVSVDGECKELLVEVEGDRCQPEDGIRTNKGILYEAVCLSGKGGVVAGLSYHDDGRSGGVRYACMEDVRDGMFLYEPDPSLMKLAPWDVVCDRFPAILKLGASSHLFVSDEFYSGFPGRKLRIGSIIQGKDLKSMNGMEVNVVVRNYPMTPADIRRKYRLKEGKDEFLYATRIGDKPVMMLASRCGQE